jgi:hypothetical protein
LHVVSSFRVIKAMLSSFSDLQVGSQCFPLF